MEAGVHLPQCAFDGQVADATKLTQFVDVARELGFAAIAANDHFAFTRPWLDGPTLLAAVAGRAGDMDLATTVALPALRGPAPLAAALATLDVLAPGRVVAGIGPGSSRTDYALAHVSFDERWAQFDEAALTMRSLLNDQQVPSSWADALPLDQRPATSVASEPDPTLDRELGLGRRDTPSDPARRRLGCFGVPRIGRRLRRRTAAARLGTTATGATQAAVRGGDDVDLRHRRCGGRRPPAARPACASAGSRPRTAPCADLHRAGRGLRELLARYRDAGCDRIYLWPIADEIEQLQRIATELLPQLGD